MATSGCQILEDINMEQYWMPKKLDLKNLRFCLDKYNANFLYIRLMGSCGGTVKVSKEINGRELDFRKDRKGLHMLINGSETFHFPLKDYQKGFSLGYERIDTAKDGTERMIALSKGLDPYDKSLPEPKTSILRTVLDDHLMEIFFTGRVNLKFHSWWIKPHFKYWEIDLPVKPVLT